MFKPGTYLFNLMEYLIALQLLDEMHAHAADPFRRTPAAGCLMFEHPQSAFANVSQPWSEVLPKLGDVTFKAEGKVQEQCKALYANPHRTMLALVYQMAANQRGSHDGSRIRLVLSGQGIHYNF